jgi:predicted lipid-binding transport protein (Tim44 family)
MAGGRRQEPGRPGSSEDADVSEVVRARFEEIFMPVLEAWSNRDADAMRPYVSDHYLEIARRELDALDRQFASERIEDVAVHHVAVGRPRTGADEPQPVQVYVAYLGRRWTEDLRTGQAIRGDQEVTRAFARRWTFVSDRGKRWIADDIAPVWEGDADALLRGEWPGLPAGTEWEEVA